VTWKDVVARPKPKVLRQFAGLWLIFFGGLAAARLWHGHGDQVAAFLGALAVIVGVLGLIRPGAVRLIYTGWMIAAFPIGWTVSQVMLVILYFVVFTPVALVFRVIRRDPLQLRRRDAASYWMAKPPPAKAEDYFRQF
jgi:saxitoxin biosynthesis operon SxtJ-like protein